MKIKTFTLKSISLFGTLFCLGFGASGQVAPDTVAIHNLGHGSVYFEYQDLVIHVDPYSTVAEYDTLPDADLIFVTHGHPDHYDLTALDKIKKEGTVLVTTQAVKDLGTYTDSIHVLNNGDSVTVMGIPVKAVPAYNVVNTQYHPQGVGNGYVFYFGEKKVYVAGDSENIPEMGMMGLIDMAFLPMNLPFTMTVAEAAEAAKAVNPDILYIYHFGTSDTASLRSMLSDQEMVIRMGKSVYYESDKRTATPNSEIYSQKSTIVFYPNPVKDHLIISNPVGGSEVFVYDLSGKLLLKQQLTGQGEQRLNLKALNKGVYLLKYQDKEFIKSSMLLKE